MNPVGGASSSAFSAETESAENNYKLAESCEASNVYRAAALYRLAADQGYAPAQYKLGKLLERGIGDAGRVRHESDLAYRLAIDEGLLEKSRSDGEGVSQRDQEVEKDQREAVRYYSLAASQHHPEAICSLAWCHELGIGVPKNQREATSLFRLAAELGNREAKDQLKNTCCVIL